MDINFKYESKPIAPEILSINNANKDGNVITAELWTELWGLVFNNINSIDAFCVNVSNVIGDWKEYTDTLYTLCNEMKTEFEALTDGLVHLGDNPPTNSKIKLWICPSGTVPSTFVEQAEEAASSAEDYAATASSAREAASIFATNANTAYINAKTAQREAEDAKNLAEAAQSNAAGYAGEAKEAKDAAEISENNADNSRINAETAQSKAEAAQRNAEISENNASYYAADALMSYEQAAAAKSAAEEAAATAVNTKNNFVPLLQEAENFIATARTQTRDARDVAVSAKDAAEGAAEAAQSAAEAATQALSTKQDIIQRSGKWLANNRAEPYTICQSTDSYYTAGVGGVGLIFEQGYFYQYHEVEGAIYKSWHRINVQPVQDIPEAKVVTGVGSKVQILSPIREGQRLDITGASTTVNHYNLVSYADMPNLEPKIDSSTIGNLTISQIDNRDGTKSLIVNGTASYMMLWMDGTVGTASMPFSEDRLQVDNDPTRYAKMDFENVPTGATVYSYWVNAAAPQYPSTMQPNTYYNCPHPWGFIAQLNGTFNNLVITLRCFTKTTEIIPPTGSGVNLYSGNNELLGSYVLGEDGKPTEPVYLDVVGDSLFNKDGFYLGAYVQSLSGIELNVSYKKAVPSQNDWLLLQQGSKTDTSTTFTLANLPYLNYRITLKSNSNLGSISFRNGDIVRWTRAASIGINPGYTTIWEATATDTHIKCSLACANENLCTTLNKAVREPINDLQTIVLSANNLDTLKGDYVVEVY